MFAGVGRGFDFIAHGVQQCDEGVFERGHADADFVDMQPGGFESMSDGLTAKFGVGREDIETVAKSLDIGDLAMLVGSGAELFFGNAEIAGPDFEAFGVEAFAKFAGRAGLADQTEVHQRHPMAALGFIEIGRGDEDGEAVGREMRERVPEFAA